MGGARGTDRSKRGRSKGHGHLRYYSGLIHEPQSDRIDSQRTGFPGRSRPSAGGAPRGSRVDRPRPRRRVDSGGSRLARRAEPLGRVSREGGTARPAGAAVGRGGARKRPLARSTARGARCVRGRAFAPPPGFESRVARRRSRCRRERAPIERRRSPRSHFVRKTACGMGGRVGDRRRHLSRSSAHRRRFVDPLLQGLGGAPSCGALSGARADRAGGSSRPCLHPALVGALRGEETTGSDADPP